MFYGARYYDSTLGRFTQPDTIVPHPLNPQSLNRFSYVLNNPVKYTDPTGHAEVCENGDTSCGQEATGDPSSGSNNTTTTTNEQQKDDEAVLPVDAGDNQYPNGKECWPHCNAETSDEEVDPNAIVGTWSNPTAPSITTMVGIQVSGVAWFVGGNLCVICVMIDNKGEGALLFGSLSGGPAAGIGASASGVMEFTNTTVDHRLSDKVIDIGGSAYAGLGGGLDLVGGKNGLKGFSVSGGFGANAPVPVEFHGYFNGPTIGTIQFRYQDPFYVPGGGGSDGFE
jgi:hypothetical protein